MAHITGDRLKRLMTEIYLAAGAPESVAREVAESLTLASLVGHDSHGIRAMPGIADALIAGSVNPRAEIRVVKESATTAVLDAGLNVGIVAMHRAVELATDKAAQHDLGMVVVRHSTHTGRMGEYVVSAAERGFMGLVLGSGNLPVGTVAPYLGVSPRFNSNPIAWGVPAGSRRPVFFDFATSAAAVGKFGVAEDKGQPVPAGWLVGPDGQPSTDPRDWHRGGALLPFGGHKGYGIIFLIELLCGGLSGMSCAPLDDYQPDFSAVFMAVNIDAFQPVARFSDIADRLVEATKQARKAPGVEEIFVPGEIEWKTFERRSREGFDVPDLWWQRILDVGARLGVDATA
jgi:LDH2 family malate/lactate/ureidoglycolate dehydrogenase